MDYQKIETCLSEIALGSKDALAELYHETKSAVYGLSLSILKNPHDSEDVLQQTYLQVYGSAPQYKSCGKPLAWIFTIVKNLSLQKIREGKKRGELTEEAWESLPAPGEALTVEDRLVLNTMVSSLSDEERQIIILHCVGGFKFREIADFMGLPLSTVLSKNSRALKRMRITMEGRS